MDSNPSQANSPNPSLDQTASTISTSNAEVYYKHAGFWKRLFGIKKHMLEICLSTHGKIHLVEWKDGAGYMKCQHAIGPVKSINHGFPTCKNCIKYKR